MKILNVTLFFLLIVFFAKAQNIIIVQGETYTSVHTNLKDAIGEAPIGANIYGSSAYFTENIY